MADHITERCTGVQAAEQIIALPDQRLQVFPLLIDEGPAGRLCAEQIMQHVIDVILAAKGLAMLPVANYSVVINQVKKRHHHAKVSRLGAVIQVYSRTGHSFKEGSNGHGPIHTGFCTDYPSLRSQFVQNSALVRPVICTNHGVIFIVAFIHGSGGGGIQVVRVDGGMIFYVLNNGIS